MPVRRLQLAPYGVLLGLSVGLIVGVAVAQFAKPEGGLVYRDIPVAEGALSRGDDPSAAGPPAFEVEPQPGAPPVAPAIALLEPGPYGALPRIAPDGTTPFAYYTRADPPPPRDVPLLSLVVIDAGLARDPTVRALELPPPIAIAFSPYAPALEAWMRLARARGHETLLELPVAGSGWYDDAGPLGLAAGEPERPQLVLQRLLARGQGYFAVVLAGAGDMGEARLPAGVLPELARRGLGLVEVDGATLREAARNAAIPYLGGASVLDAEPSPAAVDWALGALEARALELGGALGVFRPSPLLLDRLRQWLPSLPEKGLLLVPPSRLFDRLGAAEGAGAS